MSTTYHHGDLPGALVGAAVEILDEEGGATDLSLRAVARRAGVSTAAPYRHFPDRGALISAVAAVGLPGVLLLVVFVAGLVAFALWQVTAVVAGFRWVSGGERFRKRVGAAAKAIAVLAVAVEVEQGLARRDPAVALRRQRRPHHGVALVVADVRFIHGRCDPLRTPSRRETRSRRIDPVVG